MLQPMAGEYFLKETGACGKPMQEHRFILTGLASHGKDPYWTGERVQGERRSREWLLQTDHKTLFPIPRALLSVRRRYRSCKGKSEVFGPGTKGVVEGKCFSFCLCFLPSKSIGNKLIFSKSSLFCL